MTRAGLQGLAAAALAAVAAAPRPAAAVDWIERIDFACDGNNANKLEAKLKQEALTACSLDAEKTDTTPSICGVVAGTPFACHTSEVVSESRTCRAGGVEFTIAAGTGALLGWKVEGELTAVGSYKITSGGGRCELTPIVPPPNGQGGTFVKRRGWVRSELAFAAKGEGRVTFLGGTIFSKDLSAGCSRAIHFFAYATDTTAGCTAPKPCTQQPQQPGAVVEECTEEPLPEPEPEPEPLPDPLPEPLPAPRPDAASRGASREATRG